MQVGYSQFFDNSWIPVDKVPNSDCMGLKNEKLGKVADWLGVLDKSKTPYAGFHAEENDDFSLQIDKRLTDRKFQKAPNRKNPVQKSRMVNQVKGVQKKRWNSVWKDSKRAKKYFSIPENWKIVEDIELTRLKDLQFNVPIGSTIASTGELYAFDKGLERITAKHAINLNQGPLIPRKVSILDDSLMKRFLSDKTARVVASEQVLTTLMSIPYSVLPWDIVIRREADQIILDAREGSILDYVGYSENGLETMEFDPEPFNSPNSLIEEATNVNAWFAQQSLLMNQDKKTFEEDNTLSSNLIPTMYNYRQFQLGDLPLVVRSEVNAFSSFQGKEITVKTICLNEVDPKVNGLDYRKKVDVQRGSILATERLNNSNQLAKWAFQSVISGVDLIKLGYVSRLHPKESNRHELLGVETYRPDDFLTQLDLNIHNAWGIVKVFCDMFLTFPIGEYIMAKESSKGNLKIAKME